MQQLLFGAWGPQIIAYSAQNPWRVFAAVLAAILFLDFMFRNRSSGSGGDLDIGGFDFGGDGDGGGCGD
jgi:hypothetical protein